MLQTTYVTLYKVFWKTIMNKTKRLGLVLTPAEKEVLVLLARHRGGLSISALVRCLIHDAARAAGLTPNQLVSSDQNNYEQT